MSKEICDVCELPFDYYYVSDAWDEVKEKLICDLCRSDDDAT